MNQHRHGPISRRVSRRAALRGAGLGVAGLAAAALVGCGDDEEAAAPTPAKTATAAAAQATAAATEAPVQVKRGGTYSVGFTGPFAGADPHSSVYGGSGIVPRTYNYLLRTEVLRPELGIIYDLAEGFEQPDDTTYIFSLRSDVRIAPNSHGIEERVLDSEDVVQSFTRISDAKSGAIGFPFFARWVGGMDAPDESTFRLETKAPFAWTLENLGDNLKGAVVPREWLGNENLKGDVVGAGPFMLKELIEGQRAVMVANPNYYEKGRPYVDEYVINAFADLSTQRTAFTAGQIDVYGAQNIDEAKDLVKQVGGTVRFEDSSTGYRSFWMKVTEPPWDDGRVRKAMNLSMDRDQYIEIMGHGQGEPIGPMSYVFGPYALERKEVERLQPYDPTEAKKLFDAAGVSEVEFSHPTSSNQTDYVNIMVQQLDKIGITAKPIPLDAGTWVGGYFQSKLKASYSLNQSYKTPNFALLWYHTGGVTGQGKYDTQFSEAPVDKAIDDAAGTLDEAARIEAYLDAQRLILGTDMPFLNVFGQFSNTVWYEYVKNPTHGPGGMGSALTKEIWLDK